jgi:hypothetical protein
VEKRLAEVVEKRFNEIGPTPMLLGYMEHQQDLIGQLVLDLVAIADPAKITPDMQKRIEKLNDVMQHSSINFSDLENPLESYKIPDLIRIKQQIRLLQIEYLQALVREGVF